MGSHGRLGIVAALAAALLAPGCYQARHAYAGPKLLTTGPGLGAEARVVRHFREQDRQLFLLYGLLPLGEPANGAQMAARAIGEHDGAVNLRLSDGQDLVDMIVSNLVCVMGVLCGTWSVWAEGDVVQVTGSAEQVWIRPGEPSVASPPPDAKPYVPILAPIDDEEVR
jgi:hypothetical protein